MNGEQTATDVVRIDTHVHTADSYDSTASVDDVLEQATVSDVDGLVVTDHDRIDRSLELVGRGVTHVAVTAPETRAETVLAGMRSGRTWAGGTRTPMRWYLGKWAKNARLKPTAVLKP